MAKKTKKSKTTEVEEKVEQVQPEITEESSKEVEIKEETHVVEPTTAELNLEDLKATSEEDKFDENKPLVKKINVDGKPFNVSNSFFASTSLLERKP